MYCRKTDRHQDIGSFHVEHYMPKSRFPELINEYSNLFYACALCNRHKGNYWSDDVSKRVLNPCDHVMSSHLVFSVEVVEERTTQGKFNIELLRLNNDESISYRKDTIDHVLFLINLVHILKDSDHENAVEGINRAVLMLARLTYKTENRIRNVLNV